MAETDGGGTVNALHTFGANGLVSRRFGSTDLYYCWDPSGNCAQQLSPSGSVDASFGVDGFGAQKGTLTGDPYSGFGGQ